MGSCKYYMEVTLGWMLNNKVIVFLSLLSFCLFVSTLALAGQKRGLSGELEECRNSLTTTAAPTAAPTEAPTAAPTEAPTVAPTAVPTNAPPGVLNAGQAESPESQSKLFQLLAGAS